MADIQLGRKDVRVRPRPSASVRPAARGHCSPPSLNPSISLPPSRPDHHQPLSRDRRSRRCSSIAAPHTFELTKRWGGSDDLGRLSGCRMPHAACRMQSLLLLASSSTRIDAYRDFCASLFRPWKSERPHPSIHGGTFQWTRTSGGLRNRRIKEAEGEGALD